MNASGDRFSSLGGQSRALLAVVVLLASVLVGFVGPAAEALPVGTVTIVARGISNPKEITAGPDGNVWFTNTGTGANSIGRITPTGEVEIFTDPTIDDPRGIAAGPDGNLWFTNRFGGSIGRITPAGVVTNYTDPTIVYPRGIAAGPDGNLWFTLGYSSDASIGRITPTGVVSNFTDPTINAPTSIVAGPDGNLWFTNASSIGRITPAGVVSNFTDPTMAAPQGIDAGPDGALWFTNSNAVTSSIGRITPAGVVSNFTDATINNPWDLTSGPDGNLWFTNLAGDSIGRITPAGVVTDFTDPTINNPWGITAGADGNLWFAIDSGDGGQGLSADDLIGRITPAGLVSSFNGSGLNHPWEIVTGSDDNLWVTNPGSGSIVRVTPGGVVSKFTGAGDPVGITTGPDGNVWYTDRNGHSIGRITPSGVITRFPTSLLTTSFYITAGPDGNLWFTRDSNTFGTSIGRITPDGVVSNFPVAVTNPRGITAGPDGALWFANTGTSTANDSIGRITTAGAFTSFTDPGINRPWDIVAGPDGNLWFTNSSGSIGRITPAGVVTNFPDATINGPGWIAVGPDGNLWFTNRSGGSAAVGSIGRITPDGVVSNFTDGAINTPRGIAAGPDGTMWFVNENNNSIAQVTVTAGPSAPGAPSGVVAVAGNLSASVSWVAPASDGGSPISGYTVTSAPGGKTCATGGALGCVVGGLTNGVSYTFTVTATNAVGTGPPSAPSNAVVPALPPGDVFVPLDPVRILDSRPGSQVGPYSTPWGTQTIRDVTVAGVGGLPATPAAAVLNVTVTGTTASSNLRIWPKGAGGVPTVSSLNWQAGWTVPNAVTVKVGDGGKVSVYNNNGSAHVIVDVVGFYWPAGSGGAGLSSLDPTRILDSRPASKVGPYSTPWSTQTTRAVTVAGAAGVPADAEAVVLNVTATGTTASSNLRIWPTGPGAVPTVSSLNWQAGWTIPNAVTVKVGAGGKVNVYNNNGSADVVIDVVGYFKTGSGAQFHPLDPVRIQDSRPGSQVGPYSTPWSTQTTRDLTVAPAGGAPANATGVLLNVTVTATTASSNLRIWPKGPGAVPTVSSLNWKPGWTIPNAVTAKVGADGKISVYNNNGSADVIADIAGWYA